jgi:D-beta-D-heptose 7-phosphate kinase/D-beta-D-heptose 1-phosphate adenosyltransferase
MKTIFTNGVFDIIHAGHIRLFIWAKDQGDKLIVGLNSDESTRRLKGEGRPVNKQDDRVFLLNSIRYIDEVIIFDEDTPYELIKRIKPYMIVKGSDYKYDDVVGNDLAEVFLVPHSGHSTTSYLKRRIK